MSTIHATATRVDGWWAVDVQVQGREFHTQAKRLEQVAAMAADAAATVTGEPAESFSVEVTPVVPGTEHDLHDVVALAREAQALAEESSRMMRAAATELVEAGVSVRDAGLMLGVSPQRVSQLTH